MAGKSSRPAPRITKELVARYRRDADDFDRLFLFLTQTQTAACSSGGTGTTLVCRCISACILNTLSKRFTVRPKFFRQDFVNDRDVWPGLRGLRFRKHTTPRDW